MDIQHLHTEFSSYTSMVNLTVLPQSIITIFLPQGIQMFNSPGESIPACLTFIFCALSIPQAGKTDYLVSCPILLEFPPTCCVGKTLSSSTAFLPQGLGFSHMLYRVTGLLLHCHSSQLQPQTFYTLPLVLWSYSWRLDLQSRKQRSNFSGSDATLWSSSLSPSISHHWLSKTLTCGWV